MDPHTRALFAAAAFAVISGRKAAGLHDHASGIDRRIAAECRDGRLQGYDGDRSVGFGGVLPELYDFGDQAFISLKIEEGGAQGYDRRTASACVAQVTGDRVQVFDHTLHAWFTYDVQLEGPA